MTDLDRLIKSLRSYSGPTHHERMTAADELTRLRAIVEPLERLLTTYGEVQLILDDTGVEILTGHNTDVGVIGSVEVHGPDLATALANAAKAAGGET